MDEKLYKLEEGRAAGRDTSGALCELGEVDADDYHVGWISPEGNTYESYVEYLVAMISGWVLDQEARLGFFQPRAKLVDWATKYIVKHVPDEYVAQVTHDVMEQIATHLWIRGAMGTE